MPTYRWDREIESVVMELIDIYSNLIVDERLLEVLRKSLVLWAGKHVYDEKNIENVKGGLNMSAQEVINLEKDIIDARIDGIVSRAEKAALDEGKKIGMKKGREKGIEKGRDKGKIETAINMLAKGFSIEDIGDVTGLSEDVINCLF